MTVNSWWFCRSEACVAEGGFPDSPLGAVWHQAAHQVRPRPKSLTPPPGGSSPIGCWDRVGFDATFGRGSLDSAGTRTVRMSPVPGSGYPGA